VPLWSGRPRPLRLVEGHGFSRAATIPILVQAPQGATLGPASNRRLENNGQPRHARRRGQTHHRIGGRERLKGRLRAEPFRALVEQFGGERYPLLRREGHSRIIFRFLLVVDFDKPQIPLNLDGGRKCRCSKIMSPLNCNQTFVTLEGW
jgi:hypothetical protein